MTHQDTPTQPRASATARRLESASIHLTRSHHSPHKQRRIVMGAPFALYDDSDRGPSTTRASALRPGAMDAHNLPSRVGNCLHFRDGRIGLVVEP